MPLKQYSPRWFCIFSWRRTTCCFSVFTWPSVHWTTTLHRSALLDLFSCLGMTQMRPPSAPVPRARALSLPPTGSLSLARPALRYHWSAHGFAHAWHLLESDWNGAAREQSITDCPSRGAKTWSESFPQAARLFFRFALEFHFVFI